jgi:hypothetical protein
MQVITMFRGTAKVRVTLYGEVSAERLEEENRVALHRADMLDDRWRRIEAARGAERERRDAAFNMGLIRRGIDLDRYDARRGE